MPIDGVGDGVKVIAPDQLLIATDLPASALPLRPFRR
jgi:hypothetical protein